MAADMKALEAALAAVEHRAPKAPLPRSTPQQMAAARAAARAVTRHDGLMAGERLVNGEVYVFDADARDADIEAALATQAMERAA